MVLSASRSQEQGAHPLRFRFSKHVLEELERRQIPRTLVEGVLESPEQKNHLLENMTCYQSRVEFSAKQYLLRVQRERPTTGSCHRLSDEQNIKILGTIMKVKYDQEVDILRICFSSAAVDESDEQKPGIILDYDKNGDIVGIEILNASKRMENPRSMEYAVA
jgi:uncharacterized protein YuzE